MIQRILYGLVYTMIISPANVYALNLGKIKVQSYLNQPLKAELPLGSVKQEDINDVKVGLASDKAFKRAGIERPFSLLQLRFKISQDENGQHVINIITSKPIKEPFLDFILEVNSPGGRVMRQYTIIINPSQ